DPAVRDSIADVVGGANAGPARSGPGGGRHEGRRRGIRSGNARRQIDVFRTISVQCRDQLRARERPLRCGCRQTDTGEARTRAAATAPRVDDHSLRGIRMRITLRRLRRLTGVLAALTATVLSAQAPPQPDWAKI